MRPTTRRGDAGHHLVEHRRDDATMHDSRVALVVVRDHKVADHFPIAVIEKLHVQSDRVVAAADETHLGVWLLVRMLRVH
jgi:hypothetical protein